jgi:hypothetical protein
MTISWWRRAMLFAAMVIGLVIPTLHINSLLDIRRPFIDQSNEQFKDQHVFWHTVYAGFGFLNNDFGIKWDDATVDEHAKKVDPTVVYPFARYEAVVRGMVFDLMRHHLQFVVQTWFAKFGVILYYLFLFANIGLLLAFFYRKPWQIDLMFFVAITFSSLFGFLALPGRYYLLGMLACAVLYCIVSVDYAVRTS